MEAKLALLTEAGVLGDGCVKAALGTGVLTVTLSRPQRMNALSNAVVDALVRPLGTGVLTVTLSRPQRMNALSNAVVDALVAIVELCKESADSPCGS
ncbi:hypothetical protein DIPPA_10381 [Diplonema papillatum]|nr:hypothetical protein DIPPA_10381 [Diplonema papillatum]